MLASEEIAGSYPIVEREHRFVRRNDKSYRKNEIWREVIETVLLVKNFVEVKYELNNPPAEC